MAQYKGAATKRGFNPQRVESKVSAINAQTNRTLQAMQQVQSAYTQQRGAFSQQVREGQALVSKQLDRNGKIAIQNAEKAERQVQLDGIAQENQRRQKAKETSELFQSLGAFSETAVKYSMDVALREKTRQDWKHSATALNIDSANASVEFAQGAQLMQQDVNITAARGLAQSAETTGAITPLKSSELQRDYTALSPAAQSAKLASYNPTEVLGQNLDSIITLDNGSKIKVGLGINDPKYAAEVYNTLIGADLYRKYGKLSPAMLGRSGALEKIAKGRDSALNRATEQAITRNKAAVKNGVENLLFAPTSSPELRQAEINSAVQSAIQQIGFPATMEYFQKRHLDQDGRLIGPTADELYQATVESGAAPMSPIQLAKLRAAEVQAIKTNQQNNADQKTIEGRRLWEQIQVSPEYDALDINNPDSMEAREWVASIKQVYKDADLPMPAGMRRFMTDMETGAKADEVRRIAEFENNPNSVEEDTYKEFQDPKLRKKAYDIWLSKTGGGYGNNWKQISKEIVEFSKDQAGVKFQPGGQDRTGNAQSRAIENRINNIFRIKFQQALKKMPDDPTAAADVAYAEALEQFEAFKKRDADNVDGEYYKAPIGDVGANETRVFYPNLSKFDVKAAQSRQQARNNVKLDVKQNGIKAAVTTVAEQLKPRLSSLTRRYEANPSQFTYPVEVTELAEITGKKPSEILNMMLESADVETIPNFEPLSIIESDPELVQSMNQLYRTNVITQRAGAYGSDTTSAYIPGGGGAVESLIMQGEGNVNSANRGTAGDTPGGAEAIFGKPFNRVSIQEILTAQADGAAFAVGKHQITPNSMMEWIRSGHRGAPKLNEMFTDSVQSRYWGYVTDVKRPSIGAYLNGETSDPTEAAQALAREYASVGIQYAEDGRVRGQSRYTGIGGNAASITPEQAVRALKQERQRNMGNTTKASRQANGAGLVGFRKNVIARPVLENSSGQPGLDIYFEDKQVPVVMSGRVKEHGFEPGYGNYTVIEAVDPDTGDLVDVLYSHLATPSTLTVGSRVNSGYVVGTQGGTGNVRSIDGTIASIDFLRAAPPGSKDMTPYAHYDRLRRRVSSNLGHPQ